jgi:glucose-fructose oxidoreductase
MHAEYTIRALKAGKHVLCEKPMANSVGECEQMVAAARAASRKLMIGYRLRYEPYTQALIKIARDNSEMGETRLLLADAGFNAGDPKQWRLKKAMAGGGPLMDMGVYSIQATRYLSGEEPVEVNAMTYTTPNDPRFTEVEESVTWQFRFPSGILANCSTSYGAPMNRYRVCKQRGWADMEPAQYYSGLRLHVFKNGVMEDRPQRIVDHFQAEMDHFSDCVLNNTSPLTPGEDGLQDLRLVSAIYESARNGRPVKLV